MLDVPNICINILEMFSTLYKKSKIRVEKTYFLTVSKDDYTVIARCKLRCKGMTWYVPLSLIIVVASAIVTPIGDTSTQLEICC